MYSFEGVEEIFNLPLENHLAILVNKLISEYSFILNDSEFSIVYNLLSDLHIHPTKAITEINIEELAIKIGKSTHMTKHIISSLKRKGLIEIENINDDRNYETEYICNFKPIITLLFFLMELNKVMKKIEIFNLINNAFKEKEDLLIINIFKEMERKGMDIDRYMKIYFGIKEIVDETYNQGTLNNL